MLKIFISIFNITHLIDNLEQLKFKINNHIERMNSSELSSIAINYLKNGEYQSDVYEIVLKKKHNKRIVDNDLLEFINLKEFVDMFISFLYESVMSLNNFYSVIRTLTKSTKLKRPNDMYKIDSPYEKTL